MSFLLSTPITSRRSLARSRAGCHGYCSAARNCRRQFKSVVRETGFEAFLANLGLCPDEGPGGLVVIGDEGVDVLDEFWNAREGRPVEGLPG